MRLRALGLSSFLMSMALVGCLVHASVRRAEDSPRRQERVALAARLGLSDLALSSGARWLRHPSQMEPGAALADAPGGRDIDPAGAWIAPPREVVREGATFRLERVRP